MSDLYKKLYDYREKLRNKENKHTPSAIIADEPLKNLAYLAPTSLEDMIKVSGIGKTFVAKYGEGFLDVIMNEQKPMKLSIMRKEVRDTLKNLQARLTNVNRRNRMLYLPKVQSGRAIDLYSGEKNTKNVKSDKTADAALVDVLTAFNGNSVAIADDSSELYNQYNKLIRMTDAYARESGNNTLYVGYPFVIGNCGTFNAFNVAAPLVLFPVKLENVGGKIMLSTDDGRDITYNKALILCFNKFNGRAAEALPSCVVDEIKKRDFLKDVLSFYARNGINIDVENGTGALVKYPAFTDKTFPKLGVNGYRLQNSAVVGMFPMYSGEMQKDFDDIIDTGVLPPALTNLLEGADEIDDMYSESREQLDGGIPVDSEGNIDYISELNVSQELAIEKANSESALVMQGPPGTGKSQTITSMISDAIGKGKNVLVVSQKRAALSVIYSRLGKLARYCMFVDDPKDKQSFYGRLKTMFDSAESPAPFNGVAFKRSVDSVDKDIADLGALSDALTSEDFGAPMLDIYAESMDNIFKKAESEVSAIPSEKTEVFRCCTPDPLLDCGYTDIKAARDYLDDETLLSTLGEYYEIAEKYGWLIGMKKNLSGAAIAELIKKIDGIIDLYAYGRFKFKFKKALKAFMAENFVKFDKALYKLFVKHPEELDNGVKAYDAFYDSKVTADSLDFCTRLYFGTLINIRKETGEDLRTLNRKLTEYCAYAYIDRFENENRDKLSRIQGYAGIVARICAAMDKKRLLTRDKTLNTLKTTFNANIAESKRRGDMLRAIDGKRRPAISKFVEKFEFELFRGVRVFLMTPEAVSEILPLRNDLFDLLVFDEASQIYVERGVPAIARARKLVIAGDHKQLRPSSLGDGRVTVDEDEENEAVLEEESLLDLARFKFSEVMLSYHYRSRYEELIAFSNAAFYGGRLNISPNPDPPSAPPIEVHKVNGKWEDRINTAEAKKVVELIEEHLMSDSDETLGVITFNALQRDCILDLIDKKCDEDIEFKSRYYREHDRRADGEDLGLFVKNIENVQGDERDRIIFSFAYAYNSKGVMSRNFGWLNRPGGENRLNVAISRAKRKIDIVTSIIPTDLKVDDIKSSGVHVLRKYLDYAYCISDGDKAGAKQVLDSFAEQEARISVTYTPRSDGKSLSELVGAALEEKGYIVDRNVGMGAYTIDLAVKNAQGRYVIGIECADNVLRRGESTRERDVMRRKFLTSRGWKMYRVWQTDFYNDSDKVIREIEKAMAN